jgi:UDP-2,3-diacylglucosamine hydrolase
VISSKNKNIYFASDFHLGVPDYAHSLEREHHLVAWLDSITDDVSELFLMGDVFDFWFEYKTVVPKGYVRLLGKLAAMADSGIRIHLFKGNHDLWAFNYLEKEIGIQLHRKPEILEFSGKKFFLAHGDGLGPGDNGYKFIKSIFENRFNQFLFKWLHPDIGFQMGLFFSRRSRIANIARERRADYKLEIEKEMLYTFSKETSEQNPTIDYFVFGHRHVPVDVALSDKTRLILLGDWITNFTYAKFDGNQLLLESFLGSF